jgi:transcription elongation factor|mmetsp:Transcript_10952/g.14790  ORF Transcript_10952/g.14790 Transcript_10952/m.14790 type:complete len:113 (-) Transcript_10952:1356-1694(-)
MDPTTAPTTFGSLYEETITEIATWYGCAETSTCDASFGAPTTCRNCTATELSALQWGSCGVTNNPKDDWDPTYLPKQYTVAQWGDNSEWLPFGDISEFIEYPQATSSIISGA